MTDIIDRMTEVQRRMEAVKKKPAPIRPLFIRLLPSERAELDAMAATATDDRGRPLATSTWARKVLLAVARGER